MQKVKCAKWVWALAVVGLAAPRLTAQVVYTFDDNTFQGWSYIDVNGDPYPVSESAVGWKVSIDEIDAGDGFPLLQGTSVHGIGTTENPQRIPNHRVVPEPWANRDCLGGLTCVSEILRSPIFKLSQSGPISVDMIGGRAFGGSSFDPSVNEPPAAPSELGYEKSGDGYHAQGYALYDVAASEYVAWGWPTFEKAGVPGDGELVWETVTIPSEDLASLVGNNRDYQVDIFDSYLGGWGWIGFDTVRIPTQSSALSCDLNGDTAADAADAAIMFGNWGRSGAGDCNSDNTVDAADAGQLFSEWTGDPTAGAGAAAGEYNVVTGDIKVHANDVVNWYIQSSSGGLTGAAVGDLPGPGLVTDNNSRVGETALGKFSYEATLSGVAAAGLPDGDLVIYWNSDLGRPLQNAPVAYVPEPAGMLIGTLGVLGLALARRRA